MPEKLGIKNIFKKTGYKKTFHYVHGMFHPRHDWAILIGGFIVLVILGSMFNFYLFLRINAGDIFRTKVGAINVETLDREAIKGMINLFEEKARHLQELKSSPIKVTDPLL